MIWKKSSELNEKQIEKIISVAYGNANFFDRLKIKVEALRNKKVRELLLQYERTAEEVHKIKEEEVPAEVVRLVEKKTVMVHEKSKSIMNDLLSIVFTRPFFSAAVTIIVVGSIITAIIINKPGQYNYNYSKEEIMRAEEQTKYAFAIVDKIFKETASSLQSDILREKVAKPIYDGFGIVNNLFEGETK